MSLMNVTAKTFTVWDARLLLESTPLRFADPEQIAAHELLQLASELGDCEDNRSCPECNGSGTHCCECGHQHDCEECDGSGEIVNKMPVAEVLEALRDLSHAG